MVFYYIILYYVPTYINLHKCKCATSVKLNENLHVNNFITKRLNSKINQVKLYDYNYPLTYR